MVEAASGSQEDSFLVHSLGAIESIAEVYLAEVKAEHPGRAHEILEKANAMLSKTLEQSQRIMNMIQHLRSIGPQNQGPFFSLKKGSVYDSVYQVLRAMQYEFPMEKITILKILPHDLLPPLIPSGYLEAILFQLLYNAREAVGDVAGIVTVEASEKKVLSTENRNPSRFVLRVADTGPGIPQEYLARIYDPFFTSEHPCRINGMGLCLVKKMVDHCQGLMRVETSLMGTSYFIEFSR